MKWVYLPFILALAFTYTKMSLNDAGKMNYLENSFVSKVQRQPASVLMSVSIDDKKIFEDIDRNVSNLVVLKHLKDPIFISAFKSVENYKGFILGSPQVEQFGFIVEDNGRANFSVSDFPNFGDGLFMHDVLGHLLSAKMIEKKISWLNYFEAYKAGLLDLPHIQSFYIDKGIEEAVWKNRKHFEKNISSTSPYVFSIKKETAQKVDVLTQKTLKKFLKIQYGKIEFFDCYLINSKINFLVRTHPLDKIQWLELQEVGLNNYDKIFNVDSKAIDIKDRLDKLKKIVFNEKINESMPSVLINGKHYIMKYADNFSAKVSLKTIPEDDYYDVILDEAYVLGKIHRRSLDQNVENYIKSWASIPSAIVDEKMIELKFRIKDL
jgi:hypothetical protein